MWDNLYIINLRPFGLTKQKNIFQIYFDRNCLKYTSKYNLSGY